MHATVRWLALALTALLLVACTRERPTPPPTATLSAPAAEPTTATPSNEPQVSSATPQTGAAPILTPTLALTVTPTPGSDETFQYVVRDGDTLGSIALRFGADVDTLRELNNLSSDALFVGQPIYVPFVEGMTVEGMPTPTPGPVRYTIQPGDTLSAIALNFGVDTIQIIEANNLLNSDNLVVGSTIIIPGAQPEPGAAGEETAETAAEGTPASVIHVVQAGQGLFDIADIYGVSADELASVNNISNPNMLRVGQELIIPGVTARQAAAARGNIHVVKSGESLMGIALDYGVTVEEILAANEINNPDAIYEGQELIIPGD
ncbi:MAG: LysM peptidoglycan-binding domain-containing protein [Caldilineaceae bacterium]|nr:LysM peptidoglycan-binding domain-containing protein [Caldilineaceae bacterium]